MKIDGCCGLSKLGIKRWKKVARDRRETLREASAKEGGKMMMFTT